MIIVAPTDPRDAQATALLKQSHSLMQSLFPAEDNHFLSIDALAAPHIHFFTAREGYTILGTGAVAQYDTYGEIKSMFTSPDARGRGVADALLRQIEDHARELSLPVLKLETGNLLHDAHRLYARHGFVTCEPFADYSQTPSSIYMEKPLD